MENYSKIHTITATATRTSETIQDVIEKTNNLLDIGLQEPHQSGNKQIRALCPFHNEKTPSFYVSIETGEFMCHSCLVKGPFHILVAHLCKTSATDIADIFKSITQHRKKRIEIKDENYFRDILRRIKIENTDHGFVIKNQREDNKTIIESRSGLLSEDACRIFGIKVVDVEFKFSSTAGILIPLNACKTHEQDILNNLTQIRVLGSEYAHQKYLNMVNTSNILFDYKRCIKQKKEMPLVVCEGVFDHIRIVDTLGNAVKSTCSFGARMSDQQLALCMLISDKIVIAYDNDGSKFAAGKSPVEKFMKYLENIRFSELNPHKKIIRYIPQCKDFGSASEKEMYTFLEFYKTL